MSGQESPAGAGSSEPLPFRVLWHRAGNSVAGIEAVLAAQRAGPGTIEGRPIRHGVEADLKWTVEVGSDRPLLYLHHGPTGRERLSAERVARLAGSGGLIRLDTALDHPGAGDLDWLVEVKRGHGPLEAALVASAEEFARRGLGDRLIIAASSLATLETARRVSPGVATCLFVSYVFADGRVLQIPTVNVLAGLRRGLRLDPARLAAVDLVACTNPLSPPRPASRPSAPIARSTAAIRGHLARGLAGAFAYCEPAAI